MARTIKDIFLASTLLILAASITPMVNGWGIRIPQFPIPRFPVRKPRPRTPAPTPAPTHPPAFEPIKDSKYCDESNIAKVLSGAGRTKRASVSWPYECTYASIVKYEGAYQYMYNIYHCCESCKYPTYTHCVNARLSNKVWKCPSDGLHCVVKCVKKYGPGTKIIKTLKTLKPSIGGFGSIGHGLLGGEIIKFEKVPKKLKCGEKKEKLPDGKTCIRRLCIKLKI